MKYDRRYRTCKNDKNRKNVKSGDKKSKWSNGEDIKYDDMMEGYVRNLYYMKFLNLLYFPAHLLQI